MSNRRFSAACQRLPRLPLAVATVATVACAARLPGTLGNALWGDEIASARALAQPSWRDVVLQVKLRESTPPGWYLVAWAIHRAGVPIVDLRFLSVIASVALAGIAVVYARRFTDLWAATLAGLFVALGLQFVLHGQEIRAYALLAFLALIFAVALESAASNPTPGRLVALSACVAVGVLTHYFFFLTLVTGLVWLWTSGRSTRTRMRVMAATLAGLAPFLAWAGSFAAQYATARTAWIGGFNPLKIAYLQSALFADVGLLYHQSGRVSLNPAEVAARLGFLGLVIVASIHIARLGPAGRLCALLANGPLALAAFGSLVGAEIFDVRNLLEIAPFTAIVVAYALYRLPRRAAFAAGFVASCLAVGSFIQTRSWVPPPYERVARALVEEGWKADEPIALFGSIAPFPRPTEYFPPPLGWYLPFHRRLVLTAPSAEGCSSIYVVDASAAGGNLSAALASQRALKTVGSIVVARVAASPRVVFELVQRGAHFFHTWRHRSCTGSLSASRRGRSPSGRVNSTSFQTKARRLLK